MQWKIPFLLLVFGSFLTSCARPSYTLKLDPPLKSYVKIYNTMEIKSCKGTLPKTLETCPVGHYTSTGSGMSVFIVPRETIVITAGHVCTPPVADFIGEHTNLLRVQDHRGKFHQAHLIKSSLDNSLGSPDMCALWVPSLDVKPVSVSSKAPGPGQFLYYIGSPGGVYHPPTAPILTGIFSGPIDASSSMATFPSIGGSSGSVVLSTENRLVGVLFATHPKIHHVTIITSFRSTRVFLNSIKESFKKTKF